MLSNLERWTRKYKEQIVVATKHHHFLDKKKLYKNLLF